MSSAGGLDALSRVLGELSADFPAAIVAHQHLAPEHLSDLALILDARSPLPVAAAVAGDRLRPGHVLVAPSGSHTLVTKDERLVLVKSGPYPPYRPSADLLLTTLALAVGARAIAVILSGGGNDGATGATVVHDLGGTVIVSDAQSSSNYAMPAASVARADVVDHEVGVDSIAHLLDSLVCAGPRR